MTDGSRSFTLPAHATNRPTATRTMILTRTWMAKNWPKSAGQKLTEKGQKVVEEEGAREAADGRVTLRSTAPPIDVEMSDESGDEWGRPFVESSVHGHGRKHPHIFEEEDELAAPHSQVDENLAYSSSIQPSERYIVPPPTSTTPHPESRLTEDEAMEE